jgi:hypothetical protein
MPTKKPTGAAAHAKNKNKAVRQEALREQLQNQGHIQYIVDNIGKIEDLDSELDSNEAGRLKSATELRLKLVNKYLPDLKAVENTINPEEGSGKLTIQWEK